MMKNKKIGEILLEVEFITKEQLNVALLHQKKTDPKKKLGEILVELGFLNEVDLLRCLAGLFRVRYISSDKLSTITIPRWVIDLIPLEFAEKHRVLPFFGYDKSKVLSVVIPDPQDITLPELIKNVSEYYEVERYLALGSTIKAGIAKHYKNDHTAFDRLKGFAPVGRPSAIASFVPKHQQVIDTKYNELTEATLKHKGLWDRTPATAVSPRIASDSSPGDHRKRLSDEIISVSLLTEDTFIEVLNIVITVLERYKGETYKGHSARVAKMVKELSSNRGLKAKGTYYNVLGAYLHDCCMNTPEHLTLLHFNAADKTEVLRKYSQSSERLFDKARLPKEVQNILLHLFERYDGKGYPDGLKGKEIPLGSQIIATADAFIHLMQFEKPMEFANRYRNSFSTLKSFEGTFFDPEVVDMLEEFISDNFTEETSPQVIVIESDPDLLIAKIHNLTKPAPKKLAKPVETLFQRKGLAGNLAEIQVTDLIQMLSSGGNSGALELMKGEERGDMFFHQGNIIGSRYQDREGVEAFNLLIRWRDGVFVFDPDAELPEQNIFDSTEVLLIEACRVWDEEKHDER